MNLQSRWTHGRRAGKKRVTSRKRAWLCWSDSLRARNTYKCGLLGGPQHLRLRGREGCRGHVRRAALPGRGAGAGARRVMWRLPPLWRRAAGLGLDGMAVAGERPVAGVVAGAFGPVVTGWSAGGARDEQLTVPIRSSRRGSRVPLWPPALG